jgi:anti-sigma factor RsiW
MSHLGRWMSGLVDSELGDADRDVVLNHIARCQRCLSGVTALRALKRRMGALAETVTDTALEARLLRLADQADTRGCLLSPGSWRLRPWPAQRRAGHGSWLLAAAAAGLLAAMVSAAALLGSNPAQPPAPRVTPSVDAYWLQHDLDTGVRPAASPAPAGIYPIRPAVRTTSR